MSQPSSTSLNRRAVLGATGAAVTVTSVGTPSHAMPIRQAPDGFRFAFLPDIHLRRDHNAPARFEQALGAVAALDPPADFIVTGGDLLHDARSLDKRQAHEMADLFKEIWARKITAPAYHCLGNHDVAGLTNGAFPKSDPDYGLNLLRRALGMPGLFYRFDHGGWRFIVLNNFRIAEGRFVAEYDEEQMAFVRAELATAPEQPTMIIGHYPAVTAIEFFGGDAEAEGRAWSLGFSRATRNPMALVEAIGDANVKAVLSGHIHRLDRIEVKGLTFVCSGSVSGAQWRGPDVDTPPGITVVDCRADGGFDLNYHPYEPG